MQYTVLVIDDDPVMRRIMHMMLDREKFTVQTAGSVAEALLVLKAGCPNVICCDLYMPGVSGIEFLSYRRTMPELAELPVIMISGEGDKRLLDQTVTLGAFASLPKPFSQRALGQLIREAVQQHGTA